MDLPPVIEQDGKKVFLGKEDPTNPPVTVHNPMMRTCQVCHKETENDREVCSCGVPFDDGKMQCQVCKKFFDYLVGENINGGIQGCESCWKPPIQPQKGERRFNEVTTKPVFD